MRENIIKFLKERLEEERFRHVLGVEKTAIELANFFDADENKASIAGLLHDCAKNMSNEELIKIIKENNLDVSTMEMECLKTLHAPVGAFFAQKYFDIHDKEILDAIRYHTIGRKDMTLMDKIIFVSDKIEPETRHFDFIDKVKNVIEETKNLDEAVFICYDATIRSLLDRKMVINTQTIEVYNYLLSRLKK